MAADMVTAKDYHTETQYAEAEIGFPPFDQVDTFPSQVFWFFVSFILLYLVLSRIVLPRIGSTIEQRGNQMASDLDAAARLNEQAEAASAALDKKLADARAKARDMVVQTRAEMDTEIAAESMQLENALQARQVEAEDQLKKVQADSLDHIRTVANDVLGEVLVCFDVKPNAKVIKSALDKAMG